MGGNIRFGSVYLAAQRRMRKNYFNKKMHIVLLMMDNYIILNVFKKSAKVSFS